MAYSPEQTLADRLTAVMKDRGVLVPELVERLEARGVTISDRTVTRIRSGSGTTVARLLAIADALDVGLADLLLDPAAPHWPTAWALSDASAGDTAQALRTVRLVDNAARRYRDAMARHGLAPDQESTATAERDAAEALSDLHRLLLEADEKWPDSPTGELVPADLRGPVDEYRANIGGWYVGDPPDAQGRTSGTLGRGGRSIETTATEQQILRAIVGRDDS